MPQNKQPLLHHNPFATRPPLVGTQSTHTAEEKAETSPATTPQGIVQSDNKKAAVKGAEDK